MIENYKVEIDSIADFYERQRFIKEKISELTLLIAILMNWIYTWFRQMIGLGRKII